MKLLAIETATEACSVALWIDGEVLERFEIAPRRHAERVLPWTDALLAEAGIAKSQLDAIAVGRGPGAFTGVRLALALAQGMALALDRPTVAVSTLAALAMQCDSEYVLAAIDARMGEIYFGTFTRDSDGLVAPTGSEQLASPAAIALHDDHDLVGVGTGFAANDGALVKSLGEQLSRYDATALPRAGDIARLSVRAFLLGEGIAPECIEPAYLRDKVALTITEQLAARR